MIRYEDSAISSRRVALGAAAVALTVLAIGLLLVVPATMTPGGDELRSPAISQAAAPADEGNGRLRVDVIGVREPSVAAAQVRTLQAKRKQQS